MNMTNELLQMAQVLSSAQTQRTAGADSGRRTGNDGDSGFDRLLRDRAGTGGTRAADEPARPGADAAKQPEDSGDETLREVAAAMTMLMTQTPPPRIQTAELAPEALQTQAVTPEEPAVPQTGGEAILSAGPAQTELQGAEILAAAKLETPGAQEASASRTVRNPETAQDAEAPQTTRTPQAPARGELSAQPGSGAEAGDENADLSQRPEESDAPRPENADAGAPQPLFRNTETVPVKVGEAPAADTTRADLDEQLAGRVAAALKNGAQQVKLRLNPESLGTLTIDLTRTQDGALQVVFHTTTEKAADLLGRHAETLSAMLQSNGQGTVQVEVRRQEEPQQFQQQDQQNQQRGQNRRQQDRRRSGEDFLQQLRLGLVTLDGQVS